MSSKELDKLSGEELLKLLVRHNPKYRGMKGLVAGLPQSPTPKRPKPYDMLDLCPLPSGQRRAVEALIGDGVGARVLLKAVVRPGEEPLVQVQEVRAGSSYLSLDSIDLEFGLGQATVVDEIKILWPSARQQVLENVSADQVLLVTEPEL